MGKSNITAKLRKHGLKLFFGFLFATFIAQAGFFYYKYKKVKEKPLEGQGKIEEIIEKEEKEQQVTEQVQVKKPAAEQQKQEIYSIYNQRDPFSSEYFRMTLVTKPPELIKVKGEDITIKHAKEEKPLEERVAPSLVYKPLISEKEKIPLIPFIAKVKKPYVQTISLPERTCELSYRGNLEINGIEYLFVEGKKPHKATISEIIEGYRIFDKKENSIYLSKEGSIFQLEKKSLLCPLHYKGELLIEGKRYLFLEGEKTYRIKIGESAEGYQAIRQVGPTIYLLKDNSIFELKKL